MGETIPSVDRSDKPYFAGALFEMSISPIDYRIYPEHQALIATVSGEISFTDMRQFLTTLALDQDYQPTFNSLYDLTKCTHIDGDLEALSRFAAILNDEDIVSSPSRTAVIIPEHNQQLEHMVRGLVLMTSGSRIEHRYFPESTRFVAYQFLHFHPALRQQLEPSSASMVIDNNG